MPMKREMPERRAETRMLCADVVDVCWKDPSGRRRKTRALLEDISPSGACLQFESAIPLGTDLEIHHAKADFAGRVQYCAYRDIGYYVGVLFAGSRWSRAEFEPDHLLDLEPLLKPRKE
jgi:hypothetical protein